MPLSPPPAGPVAAHSARPVRSYMRRQGRLTPGQRHALEQLWPRFGVDVGTPCAGDVLDLGALFGREAPRVLEIGFGNGESLAEMAALQPEQDYLGIEVHRPGVGHLLYELEHRGLNNVRIVAHDGVEVIRHLLADASLDRVQLFFPDPWPKTRHHKRRIVQPDFVQRLRRKLKPGGVLHLATDWSPYAEHMLGVLRKAEGWRNLAQHDYVPRPLMRPRTRFEERGRCRGHVVHDLMFERCE